MVATGSPSERQDLHRLAHHDLDPRARPARYELLVELLNGVELTRRKLREQNGVNRLAELLRGRLARSR